MTKHFHMTSSRQTLDNNKSAHSNDVPTKIVEAIADLFSNFVSTAFNKSVICYIFLPILKRADIKPVHKKSKLNKSNYRSVSFIT